MFRCVVLAIAASVAALPAAAQVQRNFPANALRGVLAVEQPPDAWLNGQPARLAPGVRVRDENNLLQVTGALAGRKLIVHYTRDLQGLLSNVWVLRADEIAREPWPVTEQQAKAWTFDPIGQTWTRP